MVAATLARNPATAIWSIPFCRENTALRGIFQFGP
jgi:hypothetical protein